MGQEKKDRGSVLWAVDPLERGRKPALAEVRRMARYARLEGLALVPVHVVSFTKTQWDRGRIPLVPEIQAGLEHYLRCFSITHAEPRVIMDESGSHAGAVRALLDLAQREAAEWIMVSSHGRSGVARLVLGSFAELLVRHSPCPILFLPRLSLSPPVRASRVALFPTDLSAAAHVAFFRFLPLAARQGLEIAILHELSLPIPLMDVGLGPVTLGSMLPENFAYEQEEWARIAGAKLVDEARRHGVKARFALDSGVPMITGEAVLAAARREKARVIAMPSMSGAWTRLMTGSVAQDVFRAGRFPVWLYGPEALSERMSRSA